MNENKKNKPVKFALDSSAAFYPYFTTRKAQSMYCVGAVLDGDIDREVLKRAVNDALNRFPLYKTKVIRGYGSYMLKSNDAEAEVFDLDGKVLKPIDTKLTHGYQFRLACRRDRLTLEMFHALTDANGAIAFLTAIIRRYRELCGVEFDGNCGVEAWNAAPKAGELEDGFKKYYKRISLRELNLKGMAGGVPHRIKGTLLKDGYILEDGVMDADKLLENARAMGVSLTAYVAGAVAYGIIRTSEVKRPIVIMVPVNLRKLFPTESLSNFVTFVRLIVKKEECASFEDCVKTCAAQLKEKAAKDKMQAFISTTVRAQRNFIFRAVPLFLKWILIRLGRLFMKSRQTIIISNLGGFDLPEQMGVDELLVNLNVSANNVQNLGIVSYRGRCKLTFTSAIAELDMPRATFEILSEQGVNVAKTGFIRNKDTDNAPSTNIQEDKQYEKAKFRTTEKTLS